MSISCQQFLAWISDYVDGELEPQQAEAAQEHLRACARCPVVLATMRQMQAMLGDERHWAMPEGASLRLRQALEQGLGEPLVPAELRPAATPVRPLAKPKRSLLGFAAVSGSWRATAWAAAVVLVMLAAGVARWRASATTTSGWLIDQHCFATFQNKIADHPRSCLLRCAGKGYGLVDANGHFLPFDAKGNRSALAAVKASSKPDHLWVTVKATMTSSHELEVQDLELTAPTEAAMAAATAR
ncbi:MAG TPA: zf-HC2 domain-containing protein [Terriglobales bacterium]|nr:zf-HC2 domain-containing protein [Terriglobales bacterium]